jgi:glycosyltransferase involved in cell wall biosynthesis
MNILFVWSDIAEEFNSSWHRMINPALALRRAGAAVELMHNLDWEQHTPTAERLTEAADLVVFQRNVFGPSFGMLLDWASRDKRIVIDLDDAYHRMDDTTGSPTWKLWRLGRGTHKEAGKPDQEVLFDPTPLEMLQTALKVCGHLSTPSRVMCEDWSDIAYTHFIPNYLDLSVYARREKKHKEPGKVYIGWAGSRGHRIAWRDSGILKALNQIMLEHKEVTLVSLGESEWLKDIKAPEARLVRLPWCTYWEYPEFLAFLDVGVVPLVGQYDLSRSNLKSLEYTAVGLPWVGSDVSLNRDIGTGVLVENTVTGWYEGLSGMLKDLPARKAQALDNRAAAAAWGVDNNTACLLSKYEEIASM